MKKWLNPGARARARHASKCSAVQQASTELMRAHRNTSGTATQHQPLRSRRMWAIGDINHMHTALQLQTIIIIAPAPQPNTAMPCRNAAPRAFVDADDCHMRLSHKAPQILSSTITAHQARPNKQCPRTTSRAPSKPTNPLCPAPCASYKGQVV
jgi:hypothetical protein